MSNVQKRKRTEEEIEHEQELLVLSYITLLNMCDDMNLSRSGMYSSHYTSLHFTSLHLILRYFTSLHFTSIILSASYLTMCPGKKTDLVKRLMDPDSYRVKVRDSYLTSDKVMNIQKVPEILEKLGSATFIPSDTSFTIKFFPFLLIIHVLCAN